MNKVFTKSVSVILMISMVLSISSCGNHSRKNARKISEDDPWFNTNIFDVDSGADPKKELESLNQYFSGADEKYMVVYTEGSYRQSASSITSFDGVFYGVISTIDRSTKEIVHSFNVKSSGYTSGDEHIRSVMYNNGIITVTTNTREIDHDPLTGEIIDTRSISAENNYRSDIFKVGKYIVTAEVYFDGSRCKFDIKSPGGEISSVELEEPDNMINAVGSIVPLDESKALVFAYTYKGNKYYELDLTDNTITHANSIDYEWLNLDKIDQAIVGSDGNLYCRMEGCISKIDLSKKTVEEVFGFNWCDINPGVFDSARVEFVDCTGDSVIFLGQTNNYSDFESIQRDYQIIEFTKADKNPHAGKTVLELYSPAMFMSIGNAITQYNENNKKFHIEVVYRYNEQDYYTVDDILNIKTLDENKIFQLGVSSNMSNAMITDIVAGKGPDILINASTYGQLNNLDYLADLSPYVKDLDPEVYYTNIIEGSKTDGVLYQLPIGFFIHGIYTDKSVAGSSGIGFTFDEYQAFISSTLNGTDIIQVGQAVYFSEMFNSMSDIFIRDGKADFNTPEFKALAEYVKNNVSENAIAFDNIPEAYWENQQYADSGNIQGVDEFLRKKNYSHFFNDPTILGWPSVDGRGPMFESVCSVAISSQAVDIDACGEFISFLLTEDVQTGLAMQRNFVLNRNALRSAGETIIEYHNNGGRDARDVSEEMMFSSSDLDNIDGVILTCSKMNSENSDISMILIEEMPAYFLGQKIWIR